MNRRELILGLTSAIVFPSVYSCVENDGNKELNPIALPKGFQYPNGITRSSDGTVYVGSITSGEILQIFPTDKGKGGIKPFFSGDKEIFAVTTLRLDEPRGILWGASPDVLGNVGKQHRIFAIDINSNKVLKIITVPDGGFGNDIALDFDGGVYVTDSLKPRILYLPPGATQFQVWVENQLFRTRKRFGLSGIARRKDGVLFVTMYSDGRLFKVNPNRTVEEIELPRIIDGSDAIALADDGSLLMIEGGVENGNGRLLKLQGLETDAKNKREFKPEFKVLASGMDLPVNLTVEDKEVLLTESLFSHLFVPGKKKEIPNQFFVRRFSLRS
ncbi:SMP-30/Gluconolaconase/LRE domain protein [Calothrix parasitica NIES-267]|uniref:SMP-30/Gluconolaconase/LRE domain protein n=1 Tax=Calothrix parasitica NIES-267 TaxID=1973488 RepID=A0A1Z4LKN9_9CYAN|nr:SMP-30/Gluconolaconase/LRE domain protein [Calothrix parasitica NIES-267]